MKHCRHCDPLCEGGETEYIGSGVRIRAHATECATWLNGECPACAEVVNVVAFIGALADNDGDPDRMNVMADVQSSITTHLIGGDS